MKCTAIIPLFCHFNYLEKLSSHKFLFQPVFVVGDCEETSFSAGSSLDLADSPRVQPYRHPDCDQMSSHAGILMGNRKVAPGPTRPVAAENSWLRPPSGRVLRHSRSDLSLSDSGRSPSRRTPEIMVHAAPDLNEHTPRNKEMLRIPIRAACSERDVSLNLSSSQSESALRSLRGFGSVLNSPSSTKDNALSRYNFFQTKLIFLIAQTFF